MENYAKRLAIEHNVKGRINRKKYPLEEMKKNFTQIQKAYEILTKSITLDIPIPPSGEWILDNFYAIEEQFNAIQKEIRWENYKKLPAINGDARIHVLADKLVAFTDGLITKETIEKFIISYESKRKITIEEIRLFPIMLKIALIKHICMVSKRIITSQIQKFKVASLIERVVKNKEIKEQLFYEYRNISLGGEISAYVEFLVYSLKKEGKSARRYLQILEEEVTKAGTSLEEMIKIEHYDVAIRRVAVSNSITSLKNILRYNWNPIFEKINRNGEYFTRG